MNATSGTGASALALEQDWVQGQWDFLRESLRRPASHRPADCSCTHQHPKGLPSLLVCPGGFDLTRQASPPPGLRRRSRLPAGRGKRPAEPDFVPVLEWLGSRTGTVAHNA